MTYIYHQLGGLHDAQTYFQVHEAVWLQVNQIWNTSGNSPKINPRPILQIRNALYETIEQILKQY
jgi:hypothetical protein